MCSKMNAALERIEEDYATLFGNSIQQQVEAKINGQNRFHPNRLKIGVNSSTNDTVLNVVYEPPVIPPPGKPTRCTNLLQYMKEEIFNAVLSHSSSLPFRESTDVNNYPTIKFPMDLSTIMKRLINNYYWTVEECVLDFRLMFSNYLTCSNSKMAWHASRLQWFFENEIQKLGEMARLEGETSVIGVGGNDEITSRNDAVLARLNDAFRAGGGKEPPAPHYWPASPDDLPVEPSSRPKRNTNYLQFIRDRYYQIVWNHKDAPSFQRPDSIPPHMPAPRGKLPIYLITIKERLENGYYWNATECFRDFQLLCRNQYSCDESSEITLAARRLEKNILGMFEELVQLRPIEYEIKIVEMKNDATRWPMPPNYAAYLTHLTVRDAPYVGPIKGVVQPLVHPSSKPAHEQHFDQVLNKVMRDKILRTLVKKQARYSWPFHEPLDAVAFNRPDYHLVVRYPMDFQTILGRLKNNYYSSMKECILDVNLVFSNCYLYSKPNEDTFVMAQQLQKYFCYEISRIPYHEAQIKSKMNAPSYPLKMQIHDTRFHPNHGMEYLVQRVGTTKENATWEPLRNLKGCMSVVKDYESGITGKVKRLQTAPVRTRLLHKRLLERSFKRRSARSARVNLSRDAVNVRLAAVNDSIERLREQLSEMRTE